jgi:hypothetical protein
MVTAAAVGKNQCATLFGVSVGCCLKSSALLPVAFCFLFLFCLPFIDASVSYSNGLTRLVAGGYPSGVAYTTNVMG